MYSCPSCGKPALTFLKKWLSWSACPARCHECGKVCAISIADSSLYLVISTVMLTVSGFAAVWLHSVLPLLAGALVSVGHYFWRQHTAPVVVVSEEENTVAKRSAVLGLLLALFPSFFS